MRWIRESSLSIFFLVIFLLALVGQSIAGVRAYNEEQLAHGSETLAYGRYLVSSDFGGKVLENWQSEWLQFVVFALATVWLLQKGSNESKPLDQAGLESDQKQKIGGYADERSPVWAKTRGWRTRVYENSFLIAMLVIFLSSLLVQSITNWNEYNAEQEEHDQPTIGWTAYLARADFWDKTLQNWQSEFLAVGAMAVFTIYLRQRGSPESKPVGAPHDETASSG